jgi:hypothetical protein
VAWLGAQVTQLNPDNWGTLRCAISCDMAPFTMVDRYRRFAVICWLRLQERRPRWLWNKWYGYRGRGSNERLSGNWPKWIPTLEVPRHCQFVLGHMPEDRNIHTHCLDKLQLCSPLAVSIFPVVLCVRETWCHIKVRPETEENIWT